MRTPVISIILCTLPSCANVIAHDERVAAKAATQFARAAVVERDYSKARSLLSPSLAQQIAGDKLSETISKMHPKGFPTEVTASEFEPIPGQRGIVIYLKGIGDGENFYYRFVMEGDASSGYLVSGLFRGSGTYPQTNRKPLGN